MLFIHLMGSLTNKMTTRGGKQVHSGLGLSDCMLGVSSECTASPHSQFKMTNVAFTNETIYLHRKQSDLWNMAPSNTGQKIEFCRDSSDGSSPDLWGNRYLHLQNKSLPQMGRLHICQV